MKNQKIKIADINWQLHLLLIEVPICLHQKFLNFQNNQKRKRKIKKKLKIIKLQGFTQEEMEHVT
jgi:hypothetical protein